METKPKILILDPQESVPAQLVERLQQTFEVVRASTVVRALALLRRGEITSVFVETGDFRLVERGGLLLQADQILDAIADGVALVNPDQRILWANPEFGHLVGNIEAEGLPFYSVLKTAEIGVPESCPIRTALRTGQSSSTVLRGSDNRYVRVTATPGNDKQGQVSHVICLTRNITAEVQRQQKLHAIHRAGTELADLSAEELAEMDLGERIELLKSNILHHTQDLLNLDSIEIRMVDRKTKKLEPLLCVGMAPGTADIELYAMAEENGVTGFVAATGRSYLCEDTANDPLYIRGAIEAKSSITVPLILHDEVIGTFNVESPETGRFGEEDVQFLEIYARDIAIALNTLELLQAQKVNAASESVELISNEVALPVDAILRDATCVLERYIGHEPEVAERLRRILAGARDIKQVIQKIGSDIQPAASASSPALQRPHNPILYGLRVLLADNDEQVRRAAHNLLGRYGCVVETASEGHEAVSMARLGKYDVCIADIRLPDLGGYEIFSALRQVQQSATIILMTGFGYDASHAIVRARQEGLNGVLFKPFRVDRLIGEIENAISSIPRKGSLPARA